MSSFIRANTSSSLSKCPKGCNLSSSDTIVTLSGVPSLDKLLLNGIPVGSTVALLEDYPRSSSNYSNALMKCFASEGLYNGHNIVYSDFVDDEASNFFETLPAPINQETTKEIEEPLVDQKMSIAWRYKHLKQLDTEFSLGNAPSVSGKSVTRTFDLGKKYDINSQLVQNIISTISSSLEGRRSFLTKIEESLAESKKNGTISRIMLRLFLSPLSTDEQFTLLYHIKRLLYTYSNSGIIILTISAYSISQQRLDNLISLCDLALEFQSFLGTIHESNKALSEYNGFLRIRKPLRSPGSLNLVLAETGDLAFKIKRRQLVFEPFFMPPDLDEVQPNTPSSMACGSSTNKLEF